jgi:predicted transcriptional regulator
MELNIWEKAMGWRKRQMVTAQLNNEVYEKIRNDTLEEVAQEIEKMKAFGSDTIGSFTVVIRGMKR